MSIPNLIADRSSIVSFDEIIWALLNVPYERHILSTSLSLERMNIAFLAFSSLVTIWLMTFSIESMISSSVLPNVTWFDIWKKLPWTSVPSP